MRHLCLKLVSKDVMIPTEMIVCTDGYVSKGALDDKVMLLVTNDDTILAG